MRFSANQEGLSPSPIAIPDRDTLGEASHRVHVLDDDGPERGGLGGEEVCTVHRCAGANAGMIASELLAEVDPFFVVRNPRGQFSAYREPSSPGSDRPLPSRSLLSPTLASRRTPGPVSRAHR